MIYLSCLELDTGRTEARRWLRDPYCVHQRLLNAWEDGAAGRLLYRLEADRRPPRVLVQATSPGDWARRFRDQEILVRAPVQKTVDLRLHPGQQLRFFLRANPTARRVARKPGSDEPDFDSRGPRVGLFREEEQVDWIQRKAAGAGFAVLEVEVRDRGDQVATKPGAGKPLVHHCVDFEGRMSVIQPEQLLAALEQGIGPGKAFGFGLLSLAPAR